ncbi:MAG: beta-aspartyl-peptidase [Lentisphaerota bacterium]
MTNKQIKILKNAEVYSPYKLGKKDILIVNDKIIMIDESVSLNKTSLDYEIFDLSGKIIIPGLIDQHVHITGGGGEDSFSSRIAPIGADTLALGGVTTVLGLLGTDGTTRTVADLYANAKRLEQSGLTVFILTGSYEYPPITLTGSLKKDIVFIDKIIGAKIAISDHRASCMTYKDLANLASSARTSGMIGGKAGIITIHVGNGKEKLNLLYEVLEKSNIPIKHFMPTHLNRNQKLLEESIKYGKMGGFLDYTAVPINDVVKEITAGEAIKYALECGVSEDLITMSSDGNGSWSTYDKSGNAVKIGASNPQDLFTELKYLVVNKTVKTETAIKTVTENPAKALGIYPKKGSLAEHSDADIVILDNEFSIESVISKGKFIVWNRKFQPVKPTSKY